MRTIAEILADLRAWAACELEPFERERIRRAIRDLAPLVDRPMGSPNLGQAGPPAGD